MGTKNVLASELRDFFVTITGTMALRRIRSLVLPRKGPSVRDAPPTTIRSASQALPAMMSSTNGLPMRTSYSTCRRASAGLTANARSLAPVFCAISSRVKGEVSGCEIL